MSQERCEIFHRPKLTEEIIITDEAPPQTDEMYVVSPGVVIVEGEAPVDGEELQAVLANDVGRVAHPEG